MVAFFQHKNKRSLFPVRRLDYPAHLHRAVEFGFLEEGSGTLSVDGKAHLLEAGDAFIIFPDRVHLFENCRNIRAFLAFAPPEDCAVFHGTFSDFSPTSPVVKHADALCPGIHKLFCNAAEDPDLEKDGVLHGYLTLLLGKLIPQLPREKGNRPRPFLSGTEFSGKSFPPHDRKRAGRQRKLPLPFIFLHHAHYDSRVSDPASSGGSAASSGRNESARHGSCKRRRLPVPAHHESRLCRPSWKKSHRLPKRLGIKIRRPL